MMPQLLRVEPLSLKQTQDLLKSLDAMPSKNLGQNFLVDKNIVSKSIQLARLAPGDNVIEIGPGLGTLTRALLRENCRVFAVEFDRKFYEFLLKTFSSVTNFKIIRGDAIAYPFAGFSNFDQIFKIVANLPYNISTPWIDSVLAQPNWPVSMTLMLQKEAAHRLLAEPNSKQFSAISIFLASAYACKSIFPVARHSFSPAPKVDSAIIHLEQKTEFRRFFPAAKLFIRKIFTQRRKQMGTLLKTFAPELYSPACGLLEKHNLATSLRPEQLPLPFWWDFNEFFK
jgi:16S rRNA (adenine1518-N6/adenine1519-N6)-dimethyltransferase